MEKFIDKNGKLTFILNDRLDTLNSESSQAEIIDVLNNTDYQSLELDAKKLSFISSAGMRVLLNIQKNIGDISFKVTNVSENVYEILEDMGFVNILEIEKKKSY